MKEEPMTDALVREFLLGKVNDTERERIESLFLTDSQTRERVLAIEQELIEDYLEENLTEEDKERFVLRYAQTEEQRRKLRITQSIKNWAVTQARAPQAAPATVSLWARLRLRFKPVFVIPVAVTIVIVIVLAIFWVNRQVEQREHLAVEQELAALNSPASLREVPPYTVFLDLKPGTVRSAESQTEFTPPADTRIVELRLPWIQKEHYSAYQAEVHRLADDKSFKIRNIQAANDDQNVVRIRLRADMLRRGQYQIQLTGIANDGSPGLAEEYSFAIGN